MIELIITDDHKMVLNGLISMLKPSKEVDVSNTFDNGNDLLEYLKDNTANVLLLDINLPDINGLELCKIIHKSHPDISIIALTNHDEISFVKIMIRNGAKGYLLKNTSKEELIIAIKTVNEGEMYLPKSIKSRMVNESFGIKHKPFIPKLTRREKEVLEAVAEELTNNGIAEKLFISVKTVESHRNNLLQKLDVRNTAGLIKEAFTKGLL